MQYNISQDMDSVIEVQILDEAACISRRINTLGKA